MSEVDDPVKAALAAMENAMSVAAVAVKWHAKAEKHLVERTGDVKTKEVVKETTDLNKNIKELTSSPSTNDVNQPKAGENSDNLPTTKMPVSTDNNFNTSTLISTKNDNINNIIDNTNNNVDIVTIPKKSPSKKIINKKSPPPSIKPQHDYSAHNILVTKNDYPPPKQEGERTVKLTAYQKKELLKQKETLTRLKDEKSRILQLIRDIVLIDKSTESKIYEIEKEVQGITSTLTNLGAAAEVKGRIAQKIEKAEIDSREQLHYHKVLHLMTARLKAQQKVLKAKIRTLQLEETESKKELKQLELLSGRLHNTVQVAELKLSKEQEVSDAKIAWQKESMRRINLQISDLEAMQKLRIESNQRIRETQQQAKGDLSADGEEALVQAATGSIFKSSFLSVTNEAEKERIHKFQENLAELKKLTQKVSADEILEYDQIILKKKKTLPIVHKNLEDQIEALKLEIQLIADDVAFLNLEDDQPYEEMLDLEIQLYKANKTESRQESVETNYYRNIALKMIRLLRIILIQLFSNADDEVKNLVLDDASLLKNIVPPYTEEQITTFFKLFDNINTKEAFKENMNINSTSMTEINKNINLLYDPTLKYENDENNESFKIIQSFLKLIRDKANSILEDI